jgi:3-oxoacyl-[acyl-carrier protein] reductase/pteridine reductase
MENALPLLGKAALVTGGAKRIGRAISLALAEAGADVVITGRAESADSNETVEMARSMGRRAWFVPGDVRSEMAVRKAVEDAAAALGRIDLLVNNAGRFEPARLDELGAAEWDEIFAVNARGPFLMARVAVPHLRAVEGRIVNIGSLGGINAWPLHAHYCASKAALHRLTEAMALAFAPEVSVNCVAPGWIEFPQFDQKTAAHFASMTPMKQNGRAEDVAAAVLFFTIGPHFITGQTLAVDGGLGLK